MAISFFLGLLRCSASRNDTPFIAFVLVLIPVPALYPKNVKFGGESTLLADRIIDYWGKNALPPGWLSLHGGDLPAIPHIPSLFFQPPGPPSLFCSFLQQTTCRWFPCRLFFGQVILFRVSENLLVQAIF